MAFESLLFSQFEETTGTFSVFLFCSSNKPFVPDTSDTKIFSQKSLSFTHSYLRIDVGYECHHIMLGLEIKRAYLKKSDICAIIYAVFLYSAVRRATYHIHYR